MKTYLATAALLLCSFNFAAQAERLEIPEPPVSNQSLPVAGLTMQQVANQYGEPLKRHSTVSTEGHPDRPPINRWDYENFSVIFERDRVIHSVSKAKPISMKPSRQ